MKRCLSLFLCIVMIVACVSSLGIFSYAKGSNINLNYPKGDAKGNGWKWNNTSKTLYIFGVEVDHIYLPNDATLNISGYNVVLDVFKVFGDLKSIEGSGTLKTKDINVNDANGECTINGGYIMTKTMCAKSLTINGGYVLMEAEENVPLLQVVGGDFTLNGGYLNINNEGNADAMAVTTGKLTVKGGVLKAQAYVDTTIGATISCYSKSITNEGGVIYATNTHAGYTICNYDDGLILSGGVTVISSSGIKAIVGTTTTKGDEKCWDRLDPLQSSPGSTLTNESLSGSEYVFAKTLNLPTKADMYEKVTLDGFYSIDFEVYFNIPNARYVINGGNFIWNLNLTHDALVVNDYAQISGKGTLFVDGGIAFDVPETGTPNTSFQEFNMEGTLVCVDFEEVAFHFLKGLDQSVSFFGNGNYVFESCGYESAIDIDDDFIVGGNNNCIIVQNSTHYNTGALCASNFETLGDSNTTVFNKFGCAVILDRYNSTFESNGKTSVATVNDGYRAIDMPCNTDDQTMVRVINGSLNAYAPTIPVNAVDIEIENAVLFIAKDLSEEFTHPETNYFPSDKVFRIANKSEVDPVIYPIITGTSEKYLYAPWDGKATVNVFAKSAPDAYGVPQYFWQSKFNESLWTSMGNLYTESKFDIENMSDHEYDTYRCVVWDSVLWEYSEVYSPVIEVTWVKTPFKDIEEKKWYTSGSLFCYHNKFMTGTKEDEFSPNANLTRAQIAVILAKISGEDTSVFKSKNSFIDVPASWYHDAVEWAFSKGIASGIGHDQFNPSGELSREQLAVMLYAYAKVMGKNTANSSDLTSFEDYSQISSWAVTKLGWAVYNGLITGTSGTTISPKTVATRAQAAVIIKKFCENILWYIG